MTETPPKKSQSCIRSDLPRLRSGEETWSLPALCYGQPCNSTAPCSAGSSDRRVPLALLHCLAASHACLGDFQRLFTVAAFAQQCRLFQGCQPWTRHQRWHHLLLAQQRASLNKDTDTLRSDCRRHLRQRDCSLAGPRVDPRPPPYLSPSLGRRDPSERKVNGAAAIAILGGETSRENGRVCGCQGCLREDRCC